MVHTHGCLHRKETIFILITRNLRINSVQKGHYRGCIQIQWRLISKVRKQHGTITNKISSLINFLRNLSLSTHHRLLMIYKTCLPFLKPLQLSIWQQQSRNVYIRVHITLLPLGLELEQFIFSLGLMIQTAWLSIHYELLIATFSISQSAFDPD